MGGEEVPFLSRRKRLCSGQGLWGFIYNKIISIQIGSSLESLAEFYLSPRHHSGMTYDLKQPGIKIWFSVLAH